MKFFRNRRIFLETLFGAGLVLFPGAGDADTPTGIAAIDMKSIAAARPSGVFLVAITRVGNRLIAVGEHGVIIYSDDDGSNWSQALVPVDVTLTCVSFISSTVGWAAGHFGVILGTVDGGKTWQRQLDGIQANQLTLTAAQAAVAENDSSPGTAHALRRAAALAQEGISIPFLSLVALSPQQVVVFGANRMAMMTTDGGKTWVDWSLHIFDPLSHNIYGSLIIGTDIYLVGEQGFIFRSNDAGSTFLPLTPASNSTLFGLLGAKDGSILVYGVAGNCFHSVDNCKTWTTINLPTQDDITAGRCFGSGQIFLASEGGTVFMSKDNGVTFTGLDGTQRGSIFDMELAVDHNLIVVGSSGVRQISKTFFDA